MVPPHSRSRRTVVTGRVDHGIGRKLSLQDPGKRRFQSLLLLVEAKRTEELSKAIIQLLVYLGSLRQIRLSRGRRDVTVYGFASDGLEFVFVMIQNDGSIKITRSFGTTNLEDLNLVLGCIAYLLKKSESMTPTLTPEIPQQEEQMEVE